jgi:putative ABC transport system substrate-binding protein
MKRREFITLLGGTAAAWPLAARGQQPAMPLVGYVSVGSPIGHLLGVFKQSLAEAGFVEGRNVASQQIAAAGRLARVEQARLERELGLENGRTPRPD